MNFVTPSNLPSLAVGGRVMTDLRNLIQLTAYVDSTAGLKISTPRLGNSGTGYVVTTGKTLKIVATRVLLLGGAAAAKYVQIGYGDSDVGFSNVGAPAGSTFLGGSQSSSSIAPTAVAGTPANPGLELAINFSVVAGKYPFVVASSGLEVIVHLYGYEE